MNKQELIDKHEESYKIIKMDFPHIKVLNQLWDDIKQLDEPQKPTVPQFVADWYEENKKNLDYNIWNYIMDWEYTEEDSFKRWINNSKDAFQTIINMHQFGYKIKEEKSIW